MRIVRPRCANASLAPTPTTTGRRSRRAIAATREARAEVAPRPSASAAWTGIRPARQAGSAVASATTASAISSATTSSAALGGGCAGAPSASAALADSRSATKAPPASPNGAASAASTR